MLSLAEKQRELAELIERMDAEIEVLESRLTTARVEALAGGKRLLFAQDDDLQVAVFDALVYLGFDVEDMDKVWNPKERREDFRVRDTAEPGWVAIADATGVAKGAKASKFTVVGGYTTKYVLAEKPLAAPVQWVIVNRLIERDPNNRGELFRPDDVSVFADANGLAIDTVALYLFVENVTGAPRLGKLRAWLRSRRGEVTISHARDWLAGNP